MKRISIIACILIISSSILYAHNDGGLLKQNNVSFGEQRINDPMASPFQKGYVGIAEFGGISGFTTYGRNYLELSYINGYQFNPYLSLGLGLGLKYDLIKSPYLVPLFLDFRYRILNDKVSPYVTLDGGYSFDMTNAGQKYGVFFSTVLGISINVSKKSAINVGIGVEIQKDGQEKRYGSHYLGGSPVYSYSYGDDYIYSKGLSINLGITF